MYPAQCLQLIGMGETFTRVSVREALEPVVQSGGPAAASFLVRDKNAPSLEATIGQAEVPRSGYPQTCPGRDRVALNPSGNCGKLR